MTSDWQIQTLNTAYYIGRIVAELIATKIQFFSCGSKNAPLLASDPDSSSAPKSATIGDKRGI